MKRNAPKRLQATPSPGLASINLVRPLFESRGEAAEGSVEHGAHQQRQRAALELVGDGKLDVTDMIADGVKQPPVFEIAERPFQVFDQDLQIGAVEGDA